jgi:hypothetical protein
MRLCRHVQMATAKRSEATVVPSAHVTSTGPSTSQGPLSFRVIRRLGSGAFGTDDHQFLI